ncbi:hypothetical protein ABIA87_003708 [Bradyrhizobium sp. LA6.3]
MVHSKLLVDIASPIGIPPFTTKRLQIFPPTEA